MTTLLTTVAGIGFFIFGMRLLEETLKQWSLHSIRRYFQAKGQRLVRALFTGTLLTMLVQSSSVVGSIALALIGARLVELPVGLAMMLGANIGTTFTGWILAGFGFSFEIEPIALALAGFSAILLPFFRRNALGNRICRLFLAVGILFLGLAYMREGAADWVQKLDVKLLRGFPTLFYLLVGLLLTALIQASSATMAISLTALHAGFLTLPAAAALVLGSELGTSLKFLFPGFIDQEDKRRLAYANLMMNGMTTLLGWVLLLPLLDLITQVMGIRQELISLVAFQTLLNVLTALVFLPFLRRMAEFLQQRFRMPEVRSTLYLSEEIPEMPELAIEAMKLELNHLFESVQRFMWMEWNQDVDPTLIQDPYLNKLLRKSHPELTAEERYAELKRIESEFLDFHLHMDQKNLGPAEKSKADSIQMAVRKCIQAAKSVKDIIHNIDAIEHAYEPHLLQEYLYFREQTNQFLGDLKDLLHIKELNALEEIITDRIRLQKSESENYINRILEAMRVSGFPEREAPNMFNINREMYSAKKSLLQAAALFNLNISRVELL